MRTSSRGAETSATQPRSPFASARSGARSRTRLAGPARSAWRSHARARRGRPGKPQTTRPGPGKTVITRAPAAIFTVLRPGRGRRSPRASRSGRAPGPPAVSRRDAGRPARRPATGTGNCRARSRSATAGPARSRDEGPEWTPTSSRRAVWRAAAPWLLKPVRLTKARPAGARAAPATAGGSGSGKEGEGGG